MSVSIKGKEIRKEINMSIYEKDNYMSNIGRINLRGLIEKTPTTLQDMCTALRIDEKLVFDYIYNKEELKLKYLLKIANYFNVSLCWLLTNEDKIGAFVTLTKDYALSRAKEEDEKRGLTK